MYIPKEVLLVIIGIVWIGGAHMAYKGDWTETLVAAVSFGAILLLAQTLAGMNI